MTPDDDTKILNLGETSTVDFRFDAKPALPSTVQAENLYIFVPTRLLRTNENIPTAYIDRPTFTEPEIAQRGSTIGFTGCIDTDGVDAGTYTGQAILGGPEGVEPATVTLTVNSKDEKLFWITAGASLVVALFLLCAVAVKDEWDKLPKARRSLKAACVAALGPKNWFFWVATIISIALAEVALWKVYVTDVSWGADRGSSLIAGVGTALSAAGLGTVATKFLRPSGGSS